MASWQHWLQNPNLFQTRQIVDRIEFFISRLANIPETNFGGMIFEFYKLLLELPLL